MDGLMAARSPAGALLEALREAGMIGATNQNRATTDALEVALKTEVGVAHREQFGINGPVGRVTDCTSFAHRLVFEHVRTTLRGVAPEAAFVGIQYRCAAAHVDRALVRGVTVRAIYFPLRNGMMTGKVELAAHVEVAIQADVFLDPARR
jgi:hypothetical protein